MGSKAEAKSERILTNLVAASRRRATIAIALTEVRGEQKNARQAVR